MLSDELVVVVVVVWLLCCCIFRCLAVAFGFWPLVCGLWFCGFVVLWRVVGGWWLAVAVGSSTSRHRKIRDKEQASAARQPAQLARRVL